MRPSRLWEQPVQLDLPGARDKQFAHRAFASKCIPGLPRKLARDGGRASCKGGHANAFPSIEVIFRFVSAPHERKKIHRMLGGSCVTMIHSFLPAPMIIISGQQCKQEDSKADGTGMAGAAILQCRRSLITTLQSFTASSAPQQRGQRTGTVDMAEARNGTRGRTEKDTTQQRSRSHR